MEHRRPAADRLSRSRWPTKQLDRRPARSSSGATARLAARGLAARDARSRTARAPAWIRAARCRRMFELAPGELASTSSSCSVQRADAGEAQALIARYRTADLDAACDTRARLLGRDAGHGPGEDARPRARHHAQPLAALSDARLPRLGAHRLLSVERRLRLPRSAAGFDGARASRPAIARDTSAARRCPAIPRRRRAALVAAATGRGVRTRSSDDRVWLAFVAAQYVESDRRRAQCLDEIVPFLEGRSLPPEERPRRFFQPSLAHEPATLLRTLRPRARPRARRRCARPAADRHRRLERRHESGRRRGKRRKRLARLVPATRRWRCSRPLADGARRTGARRAGSRTPGAGGLRLERDAWDGDWYRRAYFDDGTPLGSVANSECRIDSIAQSWSVISGAASLRARSGRWPPWKNISSPRRAD